MRLGKLSEPLGIKRSYNPINPVLMSHVSSLQALVFGVNITVAISGHLCISCACSLDVAAVCADSTKKSEGRERAMSSAFGKKFDPDMFLGPDPTVQIQLNDKFRRKMDSQLVHYMFGSPHSNLPWPKKPPT
ncbi:hypothetical protein H0E87_016167 [Populus deltoides]|uniref:Uncharacterized protein n=1 Tax=Populus deltoides TaxID=3696 RepID=A0A8T2Y842_POPDE|nr:hypothetical protein H0E87_016122 [Populus deltoides]KAH8501241.1 hypothetical protein H0E87_016167 [Populus deltoides]